MQVMVVAIDDPAATHLADGMAETETLIQGTEEEDHAGIALCLLTAATADSHRTATFCPCGEPGEIW
uniref:Uncharacterized protein n=1 Tax=Salix viminalis TaxID=40686 RepID=A0A6N2KVH7_SALVM